MISNLVFSLKWKSVEILQFDIYEFGVFRYVLALFFSKDGMFPINMKLFMSFTSKNTFVVSDASSDGFVKRSYVA